MKEKLKGVIPAIITPFDNEEIDLKSLRANIERWNKTGVSGYLVLGSTGEAGYLDFLEKEKILEAVVRAKTPEKFIIAGTGCESTRATIDLTRRAAELGADCVLVLTPSYFKGQLNQERIENHYRRVADAAPVPVLLYNFPGYTGVTISSASVAALAAHPNIAGLKDSSGNIVGLAETLRMIPSDFVVLVGSGEVFYSALSLGAQGGIMAVANLIPELCVELYQAFQDGDTDRALELQMRIGRLAALVTRVHGVGGLKAGLKTIGYSAGGVRSPLTEAGPAAFEEITAELKKVLG